MAFSFRGPAAYGVQTDMETFSVGCGAHPPLKVLLNGTPGKKIFHRRGLRQGDPLSPMLFILVMGVLEHMFSKAAADDML
jgi:hypothetical protein